MLKYITEHPAAASLVLSNLIVNRLRQEEARTAIQPETNPDESGTVSAPYDQDQPVMDLLMTTDKNWAASTLYLGGKAVSKKQKLHHIGVTIAGLGLVLSGVSVGSKYLDDGLQDSIKETAQAYPEMSNEAVRKLAASQDPLLKAWGVWRDLLDYESRSPDGAKGSGGNTNTSIDSKTGGINLNGLEGTVDNLDNTATPLTVWDITTHNLSPEGYWTTDVLTEAKLSKDGVTWLTISRPTDQPPRPLATKPHSNQPSIELTRSIYSGDLTPQKHTSVIKVPVRDGTIPIAATIDGRAVNLITMTNGTYALSVPKDLDGVDGKELRVWLGVNQSSHTQKPRADQPVRITGLRTSSGREARQVREAWGTVIPGFADLSPNDQMKAMSDYFHGQFDYRLKPLVMTSIKMPGISRITYYARLTIKKDFALLRMA